MEDKNININFKDNSEKTTKNVNKMNESFYQTKKAYDAVLKSGKPYEQQLQDIDKIVKETPLNVRDMNKQIQAYQSIALSAGRETPIGREALEKASQLRDKYVDIQNETKRLADDHRTLNGVMELASIGVAGYGAVQSAMALTGTENEALQKSLQKLMAAQTLMNSINQVAKALEKESAAMLLLKSTRTKALTASQVLYTAVTGKATKATKLFKIALASTGIGLLVVAIGALIANFDKLVGIFTPVIDGLKSIGDAIGLTDFASEERFEAEQKRNEQTIANAKKEKEAIEGLIDAEKKRQARIKSIFDTQLKLAKGNAKEIERIESAKRADAKAGIDEEERLFIELQEKKLAELEASQAKANSAIARANKEGVALSKNTLDKMAKNEEFLSKFKQQIQDRDFSALQQFNIRRTNLDLDYTKGVEDRQKARNEKYKQHLQNRLTARRKIQDVENQMLKDGLDKELAINETKFARLIEDTKKNEKLKRDEREKLILLYEEQLGQTEAKIKQKFRDKEIEETKKLLAELDKLNKAEADKKKKDLETLNQITKNNLDRQASQALTDSQREINTVNNKYNALVDLAKKYGESTVFIEKERQAEIDAINKKSVDDRKKLDQELNNQKLDLASQAFSAMSNLVGSFSANSEKNAKRQFNAQKALNLAGAVTDTAKGITAALATTNPLPGGRFIEAGIVGATGLANITKIASSKFESPNKGVSTPSATSGATSVQAPNFNIVGDNNINQLAELQQQPTKAYVVSSEVTSAQALDRKVEDFATL